MQGGARDRTGAYTAVREDANPKRQRSKRPLSTDQGGQGASTGAISRRRILNQDAFLGKTRPHFNSGPFQ